jgi:protein-S-isoprenylcysteine O-methyltransferase Ste14
VAFLLDRLLARFVFRQLHEGKAMGLGWIKQIATGFVLAALFFVMPFTTIGKNEPWYFWIGSGIVASLVGTLLTWLMIESQKPSKYRNNDE